MSRELRKIEKIEIRESLLWTVQRQGCVCMCVICLLVCVYLCLSWENCKRYCGYEVCIFVWGYVCIRVDINMELYSHRLRILYIQAIAHICGHTETKTKDTHVFQIRYTMKRNGEKLGVTALWWWRGTNCSNFVVLLGVWPLHYVSITV